MKSNTKLTKFFEKNKKIALAFSGGVDSAYLLYMASKMKIDATAYYVKSQFQPQFELNDALRLADELEMPMKVICQDVLLEEKIIANPKNRCYFCKRRIFSAILSEASKDGYTLIIDGTNASDDAGDRPGMKALREMQVRSPLRECGLTKSEIREYSKEAGLFTWDKPAYACLATRIPTGEVITQTKLQNTESAEKYMTELGFADFRVRMSGNTAKIQIRKEQFALYHEKKDKIVRELEKIYEEVVLDQEPRK